VPYVFEFDDEMNLIKDYFLGDPEEIAQLGVGALRNAVENGDVDFGSVMSGQIAGIVNQEQSCRDIIDDMLRGVEVFFRGGVGGLLMQFVCAVPLQLQSATIIGNSSPLGISRKIPTFAQPLM